MKAARCNATHATGSNANKCKSRRIQHLFPRELFAQVAHIALGPLRRSLQLLLPLPLRLQLTLPANAANRTNERKNEHECSHKGGSQPCTQETRRSVRRKGWTHPALREFGL